MAAVVEVVDDPVLPWAVETILQQPLPAITLVNQGRASHLVEKFLVARNVIDRVAGFRVVVVA